MKANFVFLFKLMILLACFMAASAKAGILFSDGFDSGNTSSATNGVSYQQPTATVTVSNAISKSAPYSLRFFYQGGSSGTDGWAEQRLSLPKMTELWIKYDLYIPANYYHRSDKPGNNKFLAVYRNPYSVHGFQVNWSTEPASGGGSSLALHRFHNGAELSVISPTEGKDLITSSDLGKWMEIIARIKVPSSSNSTDGIMQMWKNGALVTDKTSLLMYGGASQNYIDEIYLLGWSNSGFSQDTYLYIDNLEISDSPLVHGAPPNPPIVQ